jgi:ABC-2 type transport system permease protein
LEGKNLWIPQSLPVETKMVLRAKMSMQLILGGIPMFLICLCAAIVVPGSVGLKVLVFLMPMVFTLFLAVYGMFVGIKMPLLNWTNETAPIKQGGAVTIVLLSSWAICAAVGVVYGFFGYKIEAVPYLGICTALFAALAIVLLRWQDTRGAREFRNL